MIYTTYNKLFKYIFDYKTLWKKKQKNTNRINLRP